MEDVCIVESWLSESDRFRVFQPPEACAFESPHTAVNGMLLHDRVELAIHQKQLELLKHSISLQNMAMPHHYYDAQSWLLA
jgi:hypothetical protein